MMICVKCRTVMQCLKTGVGVDFGGGHVYAGDRYGCPKCEAEVIRTNNEPHYDPKHVLHDEFLMMPPRS